VGPRSILGFQPAVLLIFILISANSLAQKVQEIPSFTRLNTFGAFGAYSNDSSHMLLGIAENRKLLSLGISYNRRLWFNRLLNWQYSAELLPVALESDPLQVTTTTFTYTNPPLTFTTTNSTPTTAACHDSSASGSIPGGGPTFSYVATCQRRWTIGEALSPVGFQWNFFTRHKAQPFFVGHGGYMYTGQTIPITNAGNFNFTFDLGVGIELFRTRTESVRAEYRYHHISNDWTAMQNPGIDNGLVQVTYTFGR
jgi:opacity protein-like surface antigen